MPFLRENPNLLRAFRAGERLALEQTYRAYVRGVDGYLRMLARRTGRLPAPVVGDLLQDVFVRAFSEGARQSYDGLRDYAPYLNRIARNLLVDWLRRRGREVPLPAEELPASVPSVDDEYDVEVVSVLRAYVASLPEPLRQVYWHRYVLGASQEAACQALGVTRRKLRTREDHLRKGLKRALLHAGVFVRPRVALAVEGAVG